ncbi:type IV pilin protein [endosymbiont of Lamellibrachia barhami]|uniref:type IV pilin protein n=1 Tax=endosymbiont of Lamellibrachia barhami TaxID=205975 RepID=UPI0015AA6AC2|nr:type IV pilin protein [endosymbiont of Lamellibrachia barhami]
MISMRLAKGFTLIELMITLAVMAIVVAVGYPMYTDQVLKSHRVDAKSVLMQVALLQERFYTVNGNYGTDVQLGAEYTNVINGVDRDGDGNGDYYTFGVDEDPDNNALTDDFLLTATTAGAQTGDADCATFTIDQTGARAATGADTDNCW